MVRPIGPQTKIKESKAQYWRVESRGEERRVGVGSSEGVEDLGEGKFGFAGGEMTIDDDNSIYVGGLPYNATEDSIRKVFNLYGAIVAVKVSLSSLGFLFLFFSLPSNFPFIFLGNKGIFLRSSRGALITTISL